jgi:hypothetical protein
MVTTPEHIIEDRIFEKVALTPSKIKLEKFTEKTNKQFL